MTDMSAPDRNQASDRELLTRIDERLENLTPWVVAIDRRVKSLERWRDYAAGAGVIIGGIWGALKMRITVGAILAAVLTNLVNTVHAAPYFRLLDLSRPQVSAGAFVDAEDPAMTSVGSVLAVVTHSPKDGCLLPRIACVDWTPLGVGYAGGGGHHRLTLGPSANLAPIIKNMLYQALLRFSDEDRYQGLKSTLRPLKSDTDLSVAFGPAWVVSPTSAPGPRVFAGASWAF